MAEISDLNETDSSNTGISGINVAEGCDPGNLNDAIRNMAGMLKRWFKSSLFRLRDGTDQTKLLAFDLSAITTGSTTTLKVPASGQLVAYQGDLGTSPPDLNTVVTPGIYSKHSSGGVTLLLNFPVAGRAGVLEVINTDLGAGNFIIQRYKLSDGRTFERWWATAWQEWYEIGAKPAFAAYLGSAQSVPPNTYTKLSLGATDFNFGSYYSTANGRFTPPKGRFRLSASITAATDSGSYLDLLFAKNGTLDRTANRIQTPTGLPTAIVSGTTLVEANGTDYFELYVRHGNSVATNVLVNNTVFQGGML